jgi:hypothetical protein
MPVAFSQHGFLAFLFAGDESFNVVLLVFPLWHQVGLVMGGYNRRRIGPGGGRGLRLMVFHGW